MACHTHARHRVPNAVSALTAVLALSLALSLSALAALPCARAQEQPLAEGQPAAEPVPSEQVPAVPEPVFAEPAPVSAVPEPVPQEAVVPQPVLPEATSPESPESPEPVAQDPMAPEPMAPEPMVPEPVAPEQVEPAPVVPDPASQEAVAEPEPAASSSPQPIPAMHGRPSVNGQLMVRGTRLCDLAGRLVTLGGVSTHGLSWFPEFVSPELFGRLSSRWDDNVVRLAFYPSTWGGGRRQDELEVLYRGIEAAIANDQYVIVDWHILEEGDPNVCLKEAKGFFAGVAARYAGVPNLLFEICNEPNGETTWTDIRTYADQVIPIIREHSPEAVVIVGTPNFDRELIVASRNPVPFDNVLYSLHFYAATHGEDLRGELVGALAAGLPVIVSECGLSEATGDGRVDFDSAVAWFDLLRERGVSYCVWSLSNKAESSALLSVHATPATDLADGDLTPVGRWVSELIRGVAPADIARPEVDANGYLKDETPRWMTWLSARDLTSLHAWRLIAAVALAITVLGLLLSYLVGARSRRHMRTYDDLIAGDGGRVRLAKGAVARRVTIFFSCFFTFVYLAWRVSFSLPVEFGVLSVVASVALLIVEALGFVESLVLYEGMGAIREHPLPKVDAEDFPEVDIFISTYNEPEDLLYRTVNAARDLDYPDKSKVHIWVCDDNRRPSMRALAASMGVGYFDRPDNAGAKAGNLNHALSLTSAPYVVTLDADMICRHEFLMKTIPYFVDAERRNAALPEDRRLPLGLIQTPQAFYDPDVFQHALYAEHLIPNEQDFFYRTIEVAKTATNSVIYGGSNTVLSRAALEAVGGFYTESITEDFATGALIESAGFVSLGLGEPLASGRCPHDYREHVQQRTRWGRGVIVTGRKLHVFTRPGFTFLQRLSYWSSVVYWYSPIKNLIYLLSPLLFATFLIPVFQCSWLDLIVYWLPMYVMQTLCLRVLSKNSVSSKLSGIYEVSVMPHLLVPVVKEALGISLSSFAVTDKSAKATRRTRDRRLIAPFVVLLVLSLIGLVRVAWLFAHTRSVGLAVISFWILRNAYYLLMAVFLVDGRDADGEVVHVSDAIPVRATVMEDGRRCTFEGVATHLTEHSLRVFLEGAQDLSIADRLDVLVEAGRHAARLKCAVTVISHTRSSASAVHTVEILDFGDSWDDYLGILYDRVPSLPQRLKMSYGALNQLWRNIAMRVGDAVR